MSLPVWTCTALGSENATQRRSLGRVSGLIVPQCPARDSATKQRERSARLLCQKTSLSPPLSLSIGFQAKNERTRRKSGGASGWGKKKKLTGDAGLQRVTSNCCTLHCYSVLGGANLLTTQTSAHIRTSGKRVVSDAERSKLIVIVLQLKTDALSYNLLMISPQEESSNIRKYWEIKHEHKNVSHSMWVFFFLLQIRNNLLFPIIELIKCSSGTTVNTVQKTNNTKICISGLNIIPWPRHKTGGHCSPGSGKTLGTLKWINAEEQNPSMFLIDSEIRKGCRQ